MGASHATVLEQKGEGMKGPKKGKKFPAAQMSTALRKKTHPPEESYEDAMKKGGYTRGGGGLGS